MTYAITLVLDGAFSFLKQDMTDIKTAKKWWHHYCEAYYNDESYSVAIIKLVDSNLDGVEGSKYTEVIDRRPAPTPETIVAA